MLLLFFFLIVMFCRGKEATERNSLRHSYRNAHCKNILRKLNISSPIHLVAYAVESGLVTIDYNKK